MKPVFIPLLMSVILVGSLPRAGAAVPSATGSPAQKSKLVTMSAGRVGDDVVTTREVLANSLIEDSLFRAKKEKRIYKKSLTDRVFIQEVTAVLLETAIAKEGRELPLTKVSSAEVEAARENVLKSLKNQSHWRDLKLSDAEIDRLIRGKLSAKKFLEFKLESASQPISDADADEYYKNNKFKFDNVPFDGIKENIKAYLRKKQVDDRLREWFEVLKIKYGIRNQLAEKGKS